MSGRYVAVRGWVSATHTPESLPTCTVHEADQQPVDTGLLNADGHKLFRLPERRPLGFDLTPIRGA